MVYQWLELTTIDGKWPDEIFRKKIDYVGQTEEYELGFKIIDKTGYLVYQLSKDNA